MKIRPFLKWAGNKYKCLDYILPVLPPSTRLIEPFAGSAAVFVNTNFLQYILADTNQDLINLYLFLQKEGNKFIDYCQTFFNSTNNNKKQFYLLRNQFNHCNNQRLRAALFLYFNRHGYNGLCRYNQSGGFNVPFGQYKKPYFPLKEMLHFYNQSVKAEFIISDYRSTFDLARPGDIIYCDPPYAPIMQNSNFTSYTPNKFTIDNQIELAALAVKKAKDGIFVIISNHDTEFTREQYQQAKIISFSVPRYINCNPLKRTPVKELLAVFGMDPAILRRGE